MYNRRDYKVSIAPMMAYTDRHFRYLMRLMTRSAWLYTEMVTADAIIHGDRDYLLGFDPLEQPVAVQLGGSNPAALAQAAKIAEDMGYAEINLNVGCPSDRVQKGKIGACLMNEPELVADCVAAMRDTVAVPVTVKTRLGVDNNDSYDALHHFVALLQQAGCEVLIIHARKAWLQGLSPKENRDVPPLHYDRVYQLKQDFPQLHIGINGGIKDFAAMKTHLFHVDEVMFGRLAYQEPAVFLGLDDALDLDSVSLSQKQLLETYFDYMAEQQVRGVPLKAMAKHILNFFIGCPGAKNWRRHLSEHMRFDDLPLLRQGLDWITER